MWQFSHGQAKYTLSAAFLMSLQPILMTQSKNPTGGFDYSVPLSTMFSELLKLSLSSVLLIHSRATQPPSRAQPEESAAKEFLAFMVPALIYFVNNNCLFYILQAARAHHAPAAALQRGPAARCRPCRRARRPTRYGLTPAAASRAAGGRPDDVPAALPDEDDLHRAALPRLPRPAPERRAVPRAGHAGVRHGDLADPVGGAPARARVGARADPLPRLVRPLRLRRHLLREAAQEAALRLHPLAKHAALRVGRRVQRAGLRHQGRRQPGQRLVHRLRERLGVGRRAVQRV